MSFLLVLKSVYDPPPKRPGIAILELSTRMLGGARDFPSPLSVVSRKLALFLKSHHPAPGLSTCWVFSKPSSPRPPQSAPTLVLGTQGGVWRKETVRADTGDPPDGCSPPSAGGFRKERVVPCGYFHLNELKWNIIRSLGPRSQQPLFKRPTVTFGLWLSEWAAQGGSVSILVGLLSHGNGCVWGRCPGWAGA